jgi:Calcineurin-like phosphoesterase
MLSRRQYLATASATLAALASGQVVLSAPAATPPAIGRSTQTDTAPGRDLARITSRSPSSFKVLQVCDNHFMSPGTTGKDKATLKDWGKHVEQHKPDLLVSNGDLWHDTKDQQSLKFLCGRLSDLGVPWTFTWGNHDLIGDYQEAHDTLEKAKHSLYRGGATHGDHRLEVFAPDGAKDASPVLDLFLLNSDRAGLTDWQLRWFARTVGALGRPKSPALAFFHIPIRAYNAPAAKIKGVRGEPVCFEQEDGSALAGLTTRSALRACFCGHDHENDYVVSDKGIDLVYGRATGYSGYGQLRKGAKLIDFDLAAGTYTQRTVFADGSEWDGKSTR